MTTTEEAPPFDPPEPDGDLWDVYEPNGFDLDAGIARREARAVLDDLAEQIAKLNAEPEADPDLLAQLEQARTEAQTHAESLGEDPYALDPDDERRAGWAMRRLAEAQARLDHVAQHRRERLDEIEAWVDAQVGDARRRLDDWHTRESRRAERTADYFGGLLEAVAAAKFEAALRDKLPAAAQRLNAGATAEELRAEAWRLVKHKTLDLPEGRVEARTTPWKAEVVDAAMFITWAEAHGHDDLLRVKAEPDVMAMRGALRRSVVLGDVITVRPADPGTLRREYERTDDLLRVAVGRHERLKDLHRITGGLGLTDDERDEFDALPHRVLLLNEAAESTRAAWLAATEGEVPEPAAVPGVRMMPPQIGYTVKPDKPASTDEEG